MARGGSTVTRTAFVGCGRLARSLIVLLGPAGYPVDTVVGRRPGAARSAARLAPGARGTTRLQAATEGAQLVLLAVPDRAIGEVAAGLACLDADWRRICVLHHAGALGLEPLRALRRAGAAVGLLHPLQALGDPRLAAELFSGSRARVEGDRRGRAVASRLARALKLVPLRLGRDLNAADRTAYHAAASLASNDLVALLAVSVGLLEGIGVSRRGALDALLPLVRGTLRQIDASALREPLTGPAARGDVATLRAHLHRLRRGSPEDAEIHRLLSIRLARLAHSHGGQTAKATVRDLVRLDRRRGV